MKRALIAATISTLVFLAGVGVAPSAEAHFVSGMNCHIEFVSQNGVVTVRLTNRTNYGHTLLCVLKTNYGQIKGVRAWVLGRHYVTRKVWIPGTWTRVWLIHGHIIG